MYRTKKNELRYKSAKVKQTSCPFCEPDLKVVKNRTQFFLVVNNIYGYDIWDRRSVKDHLLIISKTHITDLDMIGEESDQEYLKLINKYSRKGYDAFTRASDSFTKTQSHFHTHLIKTKGKLFDKINFSSDPYELIFK